MSTGRVSSTAYMSQGAWNHISDLLRAMAVVKSVKNGESGKWLERVFV